MSFFKKIKIKEDRRKRYIIIIVILLVFLVGVGTFLYFNFNSNSEKYISSESKKNDNNEIEYDEGETEGSKDTNDVLEDVDSNVVTDDEIQKAADYCLNNDGYTKTLTGYEKIYNDLKKYTYVKSRKNGYKDFSDNEIKFIGLNGMSCSLFPLNGDKNEYGREYYKFNGSDFINSLKQYFGSAISFDKNKLVGYSDVLDFSVRMGSYIDVISYDSNTDTFKALFGGVGGTGGPQAKVIERKIDSVEEKDDVVTMVEKAIYYDFDYIDENNRMIGAKYNIYNDPEKKNLIGTKEFKNVDLNSQTVSVNDYLDKAATITYKFGIDKNTNNYYFVSSVIE